MSLEESGEDEDIGDFEKLRDVGASAEKNDIFFALIVLDLMKEIFFFIAITDEEEFRIFEIALLEGVEEIVMPFIYMEVGDADDDKIIRRDAEGFPEFRIRRDGTEIFYVDTVRDDSYFFWAHPDVFDVEIFHGDGVGEILIDQWFGNPFEDARDEVFRMVVSGAEEWNDRCLSYSEKKSAEHVGMEEVGDDDVRGF